jgi:hypothetical protein
MVGFSRGKLCVKAFNLSHGIEKWATQHRPRYAPRKAHMMDRGRARIPRASLWPAQLSFAMLPLLP